MTLSNLILLHVCFLFTIITYQPFAAAALSNTVAGDVQYLERKVEAIFRDAKNLPIAISRPKEDIQVRTTFNGDCMVTVAEATDMDHHPDDFREFLILELPSPKSIPWLAT
eukprot:CAMPEP_0178740714 /NCGR_PEP_ID=MMETSP0744-20121128/4739_1 /TAXON_ID=913974 /ORGANISM="Nitzschia punctata, Strain CCMP561" /LENGTH=110 /DNA_ID=CAMNT_0020393509 /DNA_START=195 /DNA_END=527 /DNA_ORIENTATION=+